MVTINSTSGAVTRNEEYYALAHASRFVRPGARRIASTAIPELDNVAFRNHDGSKVLIVANAATQPRAFSVHWAGQSVGYTIPAAAVVTLVWR